MFQSVCFFWRKFSSFGGHPLIWLWWCWRTLLEFMEALNGQGLTDFFTPLSRDRDLIISWPLTKFVFSRSRTNFAHCADCCRWRVGIQWSVLMHPDEYVWVVCVPLFYSRYGERGRSGTPLMGTHVLYFNRLCDATIVLSQLWNRVRVNLTLTLSFPFTCDV